jgi:chemotaxis signal transduction protein
MCAVPAERVPEIMRPLPIEPLSRMPCFVLGLSIIRRSPVPVIDARRLLNGGDAPVGRFVTTLSSRPAPLPAATSSTNWWSLPTAKRR